MKLKALTRVIVLIFFGFTSCISEQLTPQVDCSILPMDLQLVQSTDTNCGSSNGAFEVLASGGEPPYEYSTSLGQNETGTFSSVGAGAYTVLATDSRGCSEELTVSIENLGGVNLNQLTTEDAGCSSSNGSIEVSASGGVEPHLFSLNGGTLQESNTFSSLAKGRYTVMVVDQEGCESSESVQVLSGVSYESSIKSIIANNCAVSGCHNGTISPDFRSFSNIQARASSIKSRTQSGSMPKGSSLPQSQIDLIACWVDDGALNN